MLPFLSEYFKNVVRFALTLFHQLAYATMVMAPKWLYIVFN